MITPLFITGNQKKADYVAKYLDISLEHRKLDLDEIQSLDLREVVEHKVRQAYEIAQQPVLVEDVSLEFTALGKLPGTFIRFFLEEIPHAEICSLLDNKDRSATARCAYGYFDGTTVQIIEGSWTGTIAKLPAGKEGYGWDVLFIPDGHQVTMASLPEEEYKETYLKIKPLAQVKKFLETT